MVDLHNHSNFSPDGDADIEDMIIGAIDKKLDYFGISEHVDFESTNGAVSCFLDWRKYVETAHKLKHKYADKINFLVGMEFGYDSRFGDGHILEIQKNCDLDYVINSIHVIDGEDCYFAESFKGYEKIKRFDSYLSAVLESLSAEYDYQIVGHLGYISRNAPYTDPAIHVLEHGEILREIFRLIIEKDKTLEINTSSRSAGSYFIPNTELLKFYYDLGGRNITFASDAHFQSRIGDRYDIVSSVVKEIGFKYFDVYNQRKMIKINI